MNLERRIERQQLERDFVNARTDVEHFGAWRKVVMDRLREDAAPARASPERGDGIAFVVVGRHVAKDFRDQGPPHFAEKLRAKIFLLQKIF